MTAGGMSGGKFGAHQHAALERWLSDHVYAGDPVAVGATRAPGVGASSDVLMFEAEAGRGSQLRREALVLRRQKQEMAVYPDTDLVREFRTLTAVYRDGRVPVPEALGVEADVKVLGAPFLVMRHVEGRIPEHEPAVAARPGLASSKPSYNASGWLRDAHPADRHRLWLNALEAMACVESVDPASVAFLDAPALGDGGVAQAVRHWAAFPDWAGLLPHPLLEQAREWIVGHIPQSSEKRLAWGDARIGNMIFNGCECQALIDWETPSLGGGEMDLGWWLTMDDWHGRAMGLDRLPGLGTRSETIAAWEGLAGRPATDIVFHEIFAAFRLSCIVQRVMLLADGADGARARSNPVLPLLARLLDAGPSAATVGPPRTT